MAALVRSTALLLVLAALLLFSGRLLAAPLWEVRHGDARLIVGGTVHYLRDSDYPLPSAFDQAFVQADTLYLESDPAAGTDPDYAGRVVNAMGYRDGSLADYLSAEVWQQLDDFSGQHGFPLDRYKQFKPAMVSMVLTLHVLAELGYAGGIDEHYYLKAGISDKPLGFLETPEVALQFLKDLNKEDPDQLILSTLEALADLDTVMNDAVSAWRRADMEALFSELGGEQMRSDYPAIYRTIISQRHDHWMPQLEQLLEQSQTVLVLVGSLHLGGPDSLLVRLRDAGYQVRPFRP